jgi:hypothetical protein
VSSVRTGLVAVLLLWMCLGPIYRQVFNGSSRIFPAWHMYRGFGLGLIEVKLTTVANGERTRVDRLAVLGEDGAPVLRRLKTAKQLDAQVARICEILGPDVDLRVEARVSQIRGWKVVRDGRANACR